MLLYNFKRSIFFLVVTANVIILVHSIDVEKELTITRQEKMALEMLKLRVSNISTHDWMKTDLALIRWLRAKNLNVQAAENAFKDNLKWRKENKMDTILYEDWKYFIEEYSFDDNGIDFTKRPVIAGDISEWDVRAAVVGGNGDKLLRWMFRALESASTKVRKMEAMGFNVTQWQVILNMDNFNLMQHGCLQCLPIFVKFIIAHETYFPNAVHKVFIINTPAIFEVVLRVVRPVMSQTMRDSLMVFGTNRAEWKEQILSMIPADQLSPHFGGTKSSSSSKSF